MDLLCFFCLAFAMPLYTCVYGQVANDLDHLPPGMGFRGFSYKADKVIRFYSGFRNSYLTQTVTFGHPVWVVHWLFWKSRIGDIIVIN